MKKLVLIALILLFTNISANAEGLITITPVEKFTTTTKEMAEGNQYDFKVVEESGLLKKDDIITGTVLYYEENGFKGQKASISVGNFRTKEGRLVKGTLYLNGSQHKTFVEFCERSWGEPFWFIRGGEVILEPGETATFIGELKK